MYVHVPIFTLCTYIYVYLVFVCTAYVYIYVLIYVDALAQPCTCMTILCVLYAVYTCICPVYAFFINMAAQMLYCDLVQYLFVVYIAYSQVQFIQIQYMFGYTFVCTRRCSFFLVLCNIYNVLYSIQLYQYMIYICIHLYVPYFIPVHVVYTCISGTQYVLVVAALCYYFGNTIMIKREILHSECVYCNNLIFCCTYILQYQPQKLYQQISRL